VLGRVRDETGVDLQVLSGADEARLTFLAVRRWFGWSSGRLLVLDIGGGSLEVAIGVTEEPDHAFSLPLGAGRLTREHFNDDPPDSSEVKRVRKLVRAQLDTHRGDLLDLDDVSRVVGTSKTFKQLARLTGAAPTSAGPYEPRFLSQSKLSEWVPKLAKMTSQRRAELPGISPGRAQQVLAGALVAEAAMGSLGVPRLEICPWALREGVILRRLDWMGR
jgi:exopolyphosphatase / guanosine-5'-triphosphate,3'-diphosphate pyrophosphatase